MMRMAAVEKPAAHQIPIDATCTIESDGKRKWQATTPGRLRSVLLDFQSNSPIQVDAQCSLHDNLS